MKVTVKMKWSPLALGSSGERARQEKKASSSKATTWIPTQESLPDMPAPKEGGESEPVIFIRKNQHRLVQIERTFTKVSA